MNGKLTVEISVTIFKVIKQFYSTYTILVVFINWYMYVFIQEYYLISYKGIRVYVSTCIFYCSM